MKEINLTKKEDFIFKNTRQFLAICLILLVISVFYSVFVDYVNAQVAPYSRTPSGSSFSETSVNVNGIYTDGSNVDSYKITITGDTNYSSTCVDMIPNSDEVIFNEDFIMSIGDYTSIDLIYYYGDNNCEDDPNTVNLESGSPSFSIVEVPAVSIDKGTCYDNDPFRVCYYDWLLFNSVQIFLLSLIVFGLFLSPFFRKKSI